MNGLLEIVVLESDNLGSTDSEVKKILTLHLPISEYDTLGSDSEGDGRVTSQELMSFSHRIRGKQTPQIRLASIKQNFKSFVAYLLACD